MESSAAVWRPSCPSGTAVPSPRNAFCYDAPSRVLFLVLMSAARSTNSPRPWLSFAITGLKWAGPAFVVLLFLIYNGVIPWGRAANWEFAATRKTLAAGQAYGLQVLLRPFHDQ